MKTHEETFNIVFNAIMQQRCLSANELGFCMYRGFNNAKCAAGHLIPDDKYDDEMEGRLCYVDSNERMNESNLNHLAITDKITKILSNEGYDPEFVRKLQNIHDRSSHFDSWYRMMIAFAKENKLN